MLVAAQGHLAAQAQQLSQPWLSAQELQRWQSLANEARKQEFLACRYALRSVLSDAHQPLHTWRLSAQPGSAPCVLEPLAQACQQVAPTLSLAHSQSYVVCASADTAVGVDLEVQPSKRARNVHAIASMACSAEEICTLKAQPDDMRAAAVFLKYWVLKEALFKCWGTGLDFQRIQHITCHENDAVPANAPSSVLGYAWMWEATDPQGRQLLWAICTQQPLSLDTLDLVVDTSLTCTPPQAWVLVQNADTANVP